MSEDTSAPPKGGYCSKIGPKEFIIMMAVLMGTNALAIDVMLPALDQIKLQFHLTHDNQHHYIIFSYLIGFASLQLVFGPLSDHFGRRIPLLCGLFFYTISSFACAFAPDFYTLIFLRVVQGGGAAATRVITISAIRDLYYGRAMAKILSIVMMVFMIVPVIAPATGQTILFFSNWPAIFIFMGVAGVVIMIWVFYRLPETLLEKQPLSFTGLTIAFKEVFRNRVSFCYALAFAVLLGALFGLLNSATQIYNGIYHLGYWFPAAFALVALFQALSAFLNAKFVERFGMRKISYSLLFCFILSSFAWVIFSFIDVLPFFLFMIFLIIIMFSFGAIGANFNSLAMEPLGKFAGFASSIFSFMQTALGACLGFLLGQTFNGTTLPIALGFLIFGMIACILVFYAEHKKPF